MAKAELKRLFEYGRSYGFEGQDLLKLVQQERAPPRDKRNEECTRWTEEAEQDLQNAREQPKLQMAEMEKEKELLMLRQGPQDSAANSANSTGKTKSETAE
ncbi:hypothetical protein V5799_024494, partial [Amblyomma americanum]